MIVRNEARGLARCLRSVAPHVDDMLVLDTGSTDNTVAIAMACGARVAHTVWRDDFAAARNEALAQVKAPWRLLMDGDEWLTDGAASLAALADQAPDFIGIVTVSSEVMDEQGQAQQAPSWLPRLLPQGVVYEGRIHEQPRSLLPRKRLPVVIAHDGYLPAQMQGKQGRNRRMLAAAMAAEPQDSYLAYQYAKDCEVNGEFAEALPHYQRAWREGDTAAAWRHDLLLRLMYTLKRQARFGEALALAEAERARWGHSPDFFFTLGDVLLDAALAEPAHALQRLPLIEQAWLRAIQIGERPDLPDTMQGRGSYLAAQNLAAFHTSMGQVAQAAQWQARAQAWRAVAAQQGGDKSGPAGPLIGP
jgi:tetratricopeptide (TPR) repeat protein